MRALATARGMVYANAWDLLYTLQGEQRRCSFPLVESLNASDERLGVVRAIPFPARAGKARMTGADFCKRYPTGRFLLRLAHHVVAVVDGKAYDTWDSTGKCVYTAWEVCHA